MFKKTYHWHGSDSILRKNIQALLKTHHVFCYLDSNDFYKAGEFGTSPHYHSYDLIAGAGAKNRLLPEKGHAFQNLKKWLHDNPGQWCFGHLGYDLKNEIEALSSDNIDRQQVENMHFFIPDWVITLQKEELVIYTDSGEEADDIWDRLNKPVPHESSPQNHRPEFRTQLQKSDYINRVKNLIHHIEEGDIYEVNFCREFFAGDTEINPFEVFSHLMEVSPTPFSCFYKYDDHYVMSASMERFLKKSGNKLISQPIKGTIQRGATSEEDERLKSQLQQDPKERAENVMIVDLVRNDLAKSAKTGTVSVDELFGIYPFPTVHQMISTVTAELMENVDLVDAVKNAFPMGSMTGAPKVSAMQLIERFENFKRGIFSGAIGYISPERDFDFNVVIRSFIYNARLKSLSIPVGSAITYDAIPEKEHEECLIKIAKLTEALENFSTDHC